MDPIDLFKCLSDDTRLKCVLLIQEFNELCVCDLQESLVLSQPKISRHLAELRKCHLVTDERRGKWVYYRINPALPDWVKQIINLSRHNCPTYVEPYQTSLQQLRNLCE